MFCLIIALLLFIGAGIISLALIPEKEDSRLTLQISSAIAFVLVGILICGIVKYDEPTSLEVYQGKTTLEVTYRDNVPIDSIVVYK